MGYEVKGLDDLSTGKSIEEFIDNPNYEFIKSDIRDLDTCIKRVKI